MVSTKIKWTLIMDKSSSAKARRTHSREFKEIVLKACNEPGHSVASVAQKYQVNANLVHKWRRQFEKQDAEVFIPVPVQTAPALPRPADATVRIELPNGTVIHWPADRIMDSAHWLKVLQS